MVDQYAPLIKLIDENSHSEIVEDENGNLPFPFSQNETIKSFYSCIKEANDTFKRQPWLNDLEVIEITLHIDDNNLGWSYRRRNRRDPNRFGDIRKKIEDESGINCIVRPKNPNRIQFGGTINF